MKCNVSIETCNSSSRLPCIIEVSSWQCCLEVFVCVVLGFFVVLVLLFSFWFCFVCGFVCSFLVSDIGCNLSQTSVSLKGEADLHVYPHTLRTSCACLKYLSVGDLSESGFPD